MLSLMIDSDVAGVVPCWLEDIGSYRFDAQFRKPVHRHFIPPNHHKIKKPTELTAFDLPLLMHNGP